MNFSEFNLHPDLNKVIETVGYKECTVIQAKAIPLVLKGLDVAGLAQTGTGKTAAFLLPLMDRLLWSKKMAQNQKQLGEGAEGSEVKQDVPHAERAYVDWRPFQYVLVLVPTRELAEQVCENVKLFGESLGFRAVAVYGGTSYEKQKQAFKEGVDFVVATPGRLIDLFKEHIVDLKLVRAVVFDEADRMFDMGFKDDMKFILSRIPRNRQYLVFSATLNFDVLNVAYQFGAEPVEVSVSMDQAKADNVKDEIFHLGQQEKPQYLLSILKKVKPNQAIIFTNFKNQIDQIVDFLNRNKIPAIGISSLITQGQRNRVIEQFKAENEFKLLVATDVAARGLDIKGVDLVINYDLPQDPENYVHRIGRTGRAGETGKAFSLVSDQDVDSLSRVEGYLKNKVEVAWMDDQELIKDFEPLKKISFAARGGQSSGKSNWSKGDGGSAGHRSGASRPKNSNWPDKNKPPRSHGSGGQGRGGGEARFENKNQEPGSRRQGQRPGRDQNPNLNGSHREIPKQVKAPYPNKQSGAPNKPASFAGAKRYANDQKTQIKSHRASSSGIRSAHKGTKSSKALTKRNLGFMARAFGFFKSLFKSRSE